MSEVHFISELVSGSGFSGKNVFVKWTVIPGNKNWSLLNESEDFGQTWLSIRNHPTEMAIWNHPISVSYITSSLTGWPKLFLEIFSEDDNSVVDFVGYGWCHFPINPGSHSRDIPISRPKGDLYSELAAKFIGGHPRYDDASVVMTTNCRKGHQIVSEGVVQVDFNVFLKNFSKNVILQGI